MLSSEILEKIRRIEMRTKRLVNDNFSGDYHSIFKGQGIEFDEVRQYQAGDDIRTIDWNVTARSGQTYVKRFIEERELTVMLVVDASESGNFSSQGKLKRELLAEVAAVLSFTAISNNDKVGLLIFTEQTELLVPPRKGRKQVLRIVHELLAFEPKKHGTDIKDALDTINRVVKQRGIIFLISDFLADADRYSRSLAATNKRHDLIAITLRDKLEEAIPAVGIIPMHDAETGEVFWVDTSDKKWRKSFAEKVVQEKEKRETVFRKAGVDRILISTADDYVPSLLQFFHRRARQAKRGR